ncbi:MAG: RdgB/HAM1 family non-canonical purine NTP pyrophosphatase [Candidatus Cloacimonetes bacterium]|nr:RdgB/HAM1 family non-canonical purine NTP pyrophosphatase [Candidatus Cloacimonadota bacterium]
MQILIGTKNRDKFSEIREILSDLDLELVSAADLDQLPDVIEDRDTITGNAIKKAEEMAIRSAMYVLADDTGLFVEALSGAPGVYSARYAGEDCSYRDNRVKLLREMSGMQERNASFRTVVALANSDGEVIATAEGIVEGEIILEERGDNGFGYDSIFLCHETGKTFAEMGSEEKHKISHRGRAFRKMLTEIIKIIQDTGGIDG